MMKDINRFYQHDRAFNSAQSWILRPWLWTGLIVVVLAADFAIQTEIHFSILYVVPIAIVAWSYRRRFAYVVAASLAFIHIPTVMIGPHAVDWSALVISSIFRLIIFEGVVLFMSILHELRFLRGLIHVCSYCGRVRDGERWVGMQQYVTDHSEAMLSHGICSDCLPRVRQSLFERSKEGT
jgi:hypothetical protein